MKKTPAGVGEAGVLVRITNSDAFSWEPKHALHWYS